MSFQYSTDFTIIRNGSSICVYKAGDIPSGTILENPQLLKVSGNHIPPLPPPSPMTNSQYQQWLNSLRKKGFTVI